MKSQVLALVLVMAPFISAFGAEEKIDGLRKEVKALRADVAKLSARLAGDAELGKRLVAIARKLKAGEKIEEGTPDMAALRAVLRSGSSGYYSSSNPVFSRGLGLIRKLPSEQRAKLLSEVLLDVAVADRSRETALKELALYKDDAAKKVISAACDLELLVPPVSAGYAHRTSYFLGKLVVAAAEVKDKRAVELAIACLESSFKNGLASKYAAKYGVSLYGENGKLAERLAAWSDYKGWGELLTKNVYQGKWARGGGMKRYTFKGDNPKLALAELAKVREWWKENREKFEFPKEAPKPVEAPKPPKPQGEPKPPVEKF